MKKEYIIAAILMVIILAAPFILNSLTGNAIGGPNTNDIDNCTG